MFKALVVALLSVIAAGVVYLAVRETPGEKVLRAADELVAPRATTRAAEARQTTARADSSNLFQALKLYKLDTKRYPTEAEGLAVLVAGSPRPYRHVPRQSLRDAPRSHGRTLRWLLHGPSAAA